MSISVLWRKHAEALQEVKSTSSIHMDSAVSTNKSLYALGRRSQTGSARSIEDMIEDIIAKHRGVDWARLK